LFIRSGQANISDISELKANNKNKAEIIPAASRRAPVSEKNPGRLLEYLASRKYYILALFAVYILGAAIGAALTRSLERGEIINLCSIVDNYFTGLPAINMTARILGNIAVNLVFIFGAYLCGVTIFAALVCSAFILYKGLSAGFIAGVYMTGGGTSFHSAVCGFSFILNLFVMIFFILICAEAMSFSSFLFKSEDSFKSSMNFKNISVYSSRFMLITILIALATVVQTIAVPLVYAWIA
jgi:hypothetical protein